MSHQNKDKLTLHQSATYQIVVPGQIDERWADWIEGMTVSVHYTDTSSCVTTLTCTMDQAALHGLLRRLYSLGLPLISVDCMDLVPDDESNSRS